MPTPPTDGRPALDRFEWTQYPGHGPGVELLGTPRTALDLGCGDGAEAVYLTGRGVHVTGVDHAPAQIARARRHTGIPGLSFTEDDVVSFLSGTTAVWDAIYSMWGAAWFTDPELLLPLVASHLVPGGRFVFAHAEALEGYYGPQGIYAHGLAGAKRLEERWAYTPQTWADICKRAGFGDVEAQVLPAPDPQCVGTLLVSATAH